MNVLSWYAQRGSRLASTALERVFAVRPTATSPPDPPPSSATNSLRTRAVQSTPCRTKTIPRCKCTITPITFTSSLLTTTHQHSGCAGEGILERPRRAHVKELQKDNSLLKKKVQRLEAERDYELQLAEQEKGMRKIYPSRINTIASIGSIADESVNLLEQTREDAKHSRILVCPGALTTSSTTTPTTRTPAAMPAKLTAASRWPSKSTCQRSSVAISLYSRRC